MVARWLNVGALAGFAALFGCHYNGKPDVPPVDNDPPPDSSPVDAVARVRLESTLASPAGRLDRFPAATWTLDAPPGIALEVRAVAPGASPEGRGFRGSPPAAGLVRYLAPDGTWSESEVAFDTAPPAQRTFTATVPLLTAGQWRLEVLAVDAAHRVLAMAPASVLLSNEPALQVSLDRTAALDGDAIAGEVVMARGERARDVKLLVWWQGPEGTAETLPTGAGLAYEGPAADMRVPVLARRLEGRRTGAHALVARLFDAETGAQLAYGAAALEVCASAQTLTGTVVNTADALIGGDPTSTEVRALSLDGPHERVVAVGLDGSFQALLEPGTWLLDARMADAGGLLSGPFVVVEVGCAAPAPVRLVVDGTSARPGGTPRPLVVVSSPMGTPPVLPETPATPAICESGERIRLPLLPDPEIVLTGSDADLFASITESMGYHLSRGSNHALSVITPMITERTFRLAQLQQSLPDDTGKYTRMASSVFAAQVFASAALKIVKGENLQIVVLRLRVLDDEGTILGAAERSFSLADLALQRPIFNAVPELVQSLLSQGIVDKLRESLVRPVSRGSR
jgi:hypothetical protein